MSDLSATRFGVTPESDDFLVILNESGPRLGRDVNGEESEDGSIWLTSPHVEAWAQFTAESQIVWRDPPRRQPALPVIRRLLGLEAEYAGDDFWKRPVSP